MPNFLCAQCECLVSTNQNESKIRQPKYSIQGFLSGCPPVTEKLSVKAPILPTKAWHLWQAFGSEKVERSKPLAVPIRKYAPVDSLTKFP